MLQSYMDTAGYYDSAINKKSDILTWIIKMLYCICLKDYVTVKLPQMIA